MPTLDIKWSTTPAEWRNIYSSAALHEIHPSFNAIDAPFLTATGIRQLTLKAHTDIKIVNTGVHKVFRSGASDIAMAFDTTLIDDGAAVQAGKDYYVYLCDKADGTAEILVSLNATYPLGYTAYSSRKVGGFHTLCAGVGTISGHPLTGFVAGDILPASIWCLNHRAECGNEGMVWSDGAKVWVDIYLQSGTAASTASINGGTITDTRTWWDHADDFAAIGKRLLKDYEFQTIAAGSNEGTNITGSADPVTTGGHSDTAARRMISNIGCEDCCGAMWQWLDEQSYRADGTTWAWQDVTGGKGQLYVQGTYGTVRLRAGGAWGDGARCGSRGRAARSYPWNADAVIAGRGCARSRHA